MQHPNFPGAANIGFDLGNHLVAVGVGDIDRLIETGARDAWLRLRVQFDECDTLRCLLCLQGAIDDVLVQRLPPHTVAELKTWYQNHIADE